MVQQKMLQGQAKLHNFVGNHSSVTISDAFDSIAQTSLLLSAPSVREKPDCLG